jgi:hypothetical protein
MGATTDKCLKSPQSENKLVTSQPNEHKLVTPQPNKQPVSALIFTSASTLYPEHVQSRIKVFIEDSKKYRCSHSARLMRVPITISELRSYELSVLKALQRETSFKVPLLCLYVGKVLVQPNLIVNLDLQAEIAEFSRRTLESIGGDLQLYGEAYTDLLVDCLSVLHPQQDSQFYLQVLQAVEFAQQFRLMFLVNDLTGVDVLKALRRYWGKSSIPIEHWRRLELMLFTSSSKGLDFQIGWRSQNCIYYTHMASGVKGKFTIRSQAKRDCSLCEIPGWCILATGGEQSRDSVGINVRREGVMVTFPPLLHSREKHGSVYYDGFVYVVGGVNPGISCERLNVQSLSWESFDPTPTTSLLSYTTLVSHPYSRSIFSVCGFNCVLKLSLGELTWDKIPIELPYSTFHIAAFSLGADLYFVQRSKLYGIDLERGLLFQVKTLKDYIMSSGQSFYTQGRLYCSDSEGDVIVHQIGGMISKPPQ